jgi:putative endonuclease
MNLQVNKKAFTPLEILREMFYTYVLQSKKDGKWYTGSTKDLRKRQEEHNNGRIFSTKNKGPFEVIYYEACHSESDGRDREKYLKTGQGKRYLKNRLKRFLSLTGFTPLERRRQRRLTTAFGGLSLTGFTLMELLLAVTLMGFVMLIAANVEVATRTFYFRADRQGQLQVRLSAAMEHMVKNISLAHGQVNNSGINPITANSIAVRLDLTHTPLDYSDDTWVNYRQVGNQIIYCSNWNGAACSVGEETLVTGNVTTLQFTPHFAAPRANLEISITGVDVDIPSVTLHTVVYPRSSSYN